VGVCQWSGNQGDAGDALNLALAMDAAFIKIASLIFPMSKNPSALTTAIDHSEASKSLETEDWRAIIGLSEARDQNAFGDIFSNPVSMHASDIKGDIPKPASSMLLPVHDTRPLPPHQFISH
jgi:hypothetical protein